MLDFTSPTHTGEEFTLSTQTKPVVLFFYPRDDTPGCTIENQDFARLYPQFVKLGVILIGISRDTVKSHCKFADKFSLPFPLLADPEETVCNLFKVMKDKKMYGKDVRGIERSTFIFDTKHNIIKEWRKVTVDGHAEEDLDFIKTI